MLSRRLLAKRTRWVWIALLALSPVAYGLSLLLAWKHDPNVHAGLAIDRAQATAIARREAYSHGVSPVGWEALSLMKSTGLLQFYYQKVSGEDREIARRVAPDIILRVLLRSPDHGENIEIEMDRQGRPLGFNRRIPLLRETGEIEEPAARRIAQEALRERLAQLPATENAALRAAAATPPELKLHEQTLEGVTTRRYTWRWPLGSLPELTLESVFTVRGETLLGDEIRAELDPAYVQQVLDDRSPVRIGSRILYGIAVVLVLLLGVYRFAQRVKQKELSYSRIAVLSLTFTMGMSLYTLFTDVAVYEVSRSPGFPVSNAIIRFTACMAYAFLSLFIGLAYGSGEGDIRESYPGKLTSLDAFLTGKLLSKNVATAIACGWAIGGWVSLSKGLSLLPWQGIPGQGEPYAPMDPWIGLFPWTAPLTSWILDVMLISILGLLLPLPFLRRRFQSPRVFLPLLALFMWIACSAPYLSFRPWYGIGLMGIGRAALFLLAFFYFDLLTAVVAISTPTIVTFSFSMIAQPNATIHHAGLASAITAGLSLVAAIVFSLRGRQYREDEVSPIYAHHLAERLSMQVEVSTAREAQKRLMPEHLPRSSAFEIAAACLPAFEVGGDFYDLYELEPGKIGVLVAEGGGKGLGAALSIAFAKGFLLPKIMKKDRARNGADDSPTEILRGLQDRLTHLLDDEDGVGLLYAVIDSTDGSLRYARVGAYPVARVFQGGDKPLLRPEETNMKFKPSGPASRASLEITEGMLFLNPGDTVAFYTDGIARAWKSVDEAAEEELSRILRQGAPDDQLQSALDKGVQECSKRARRQGTEDDLTAVAIKVKDATEPKGEAA